MTLNKDFSSAVVEDLVSRCVNSAEDGGDLGASIVEKLQEDLKYRKNLPKITMTRC